MLTTMPALPPLSAETLPMLRPYSSGPVEPLLDGRPVEDARCSSRTATAGSCR